MVLRALTSLKAELAKEAQQSPRLAEARAEPAVKVNLNANGSESEGQEPERQMPAAKKDPSRERRASP